MTAIWLSPVYENPSGATYYHGYAPVNFLSVDPRKGTLDEYRTIVNEAHARGIRVLFDWVCNHTCHAFDYEHDDTYFRELNNGPPKNISRWTRQLIPDDLMNKDNFYRRGDIFDWNNEDHRIKGDFFTYEHGQSYCALDLSRRKTQEIMIHIALFWMANTGIDGFRCDAVIHVDPCFWRRFNFAVRKFARERMGKNNFLLLGEAFATDADVLAGFLSPYWGGFDSVFDFEDYFCAVGLFRGERHANRLKLAHDASRTVLKTATETLHLSSSSSSNNSSDENEVVPPKFFTKVIDSHDVERYLRSNDSIRRLDVGLTYLLTTSGMPILLYGTEQGLRNGALSKQLEQFNLDLSRVDMFPEGQFKSAGGVHPVNAFCSDSRGYKLVRRLARVRARFVALRRGELWSRRADDCGTYVFSRLFMNGEEEEEVVVAINPGEAEVRLIDVHVHHRGMEERVLVDVLEQEEIKEQKDDESVCYRTTTRSGTNGGTVVDIVVPAMSGRILVDACKLDM